MRRVAEEVLARPEYRENAPGLLQRIYGLVGEFLGRVLEAIIGAGERNLVGTIAVVVLIAVLVVLVVRFLRGVRRDPRQDLALAGAQGRPPRAWQAEAEEHERAGRWRDAVRCRYRLLLARLAARGLIEEVPGRTSGEYLREALDALPAAAADLRAVTLAFERVWYGNRQPNEEEAREVANAVDRVEALARADRVPALAGSGGPRTLPGSGGPR